MLTRFDHLVVGVGALDAAVELWRDRLGFDAQPGGRHTGRGTHNAIVRFGLDYVELISIYDEAEVESRGDPNALALAALINRAAGGILGFALATDDVAGDAVRLRHAGLALGGPAPMERLRPDGRVLQWRLLVPIGGSWGKPVPFFIQWDVADDERLSWEPPGRHSNGATAVAAVAIVVDDLALGLALYQRQLGLEPVLEDEVAALQARRVRFRVGHTSLDLLAPTGPGIVSSALDDGGERPWQVTIGVRYLPAAREYLAAHGTRTAPAPGDAQGLLIESEDALQARIVLAAALGTVTQ